MEGLWLHTRLRVVNGAIMVEIVLGALPCDMIYAVDGYLDTISCRV
jgi:hypothetical protein